MDFIYGESARTIFHAGSVSLPEAPAAFQNTRADTCENPVALRGRWCPSDSFHLQASARNSGCPCGLHRPDA